MFYVSLAVVALLLVVFLVGRQILSRRRARLEKISDMTSGRDLLAQWPYTPEEWRQAVEQEFEWAKNRDGAGHVYISPTAIYIKGAGEDRFIDLSADGRVVTHASCRASHMSPLKLRLRWKAVERYEDATDRVKYYKEDLRIPVPLAHHEQARRVAEFFTARIEANMEAYTALVPEDEAISLFGKDSF